MDFSTQTGIAKSIIKTRSLCDPRLWPFYTVILIVSDAIVLSVEAGYFVYKPNPINALIILAAGLCCLGWLARWLTVGRVADLLEASGLFTAMVTASSILSAIAAATDGPTADSWLERLDSIFFLGLRRDDVIGLFDQSQLWHAIFNAAYCSIAWQPFALLALCFLVGRPDRGWGFLGAWFAALVVTLAIFPFAPAVIAPGHHYEPWVAILQGLRDGQVRNLDPDILIGLISFPSFHAAAAVLLGWSFARFGRWAAPPVALNVVMFVSAIVIGHHYLIDLVGGAIVAIGVTVAVGRWPLCRNADTVTTQLPARSARTVKPVSRTSAKPPSMRSISGALFSSR